MLPPFPTHEPSLDFRFVRNRLDRRADLRDDAAVQARLRAGPEARWLVLAGGEALIAEGTSPTALHDAATVRRLGGDPETGAFLGLDGAAGLFAVAIERDAEAPLLDGFTAIDLRTLAIDGRLEATEFGALATARALLAWHDGHRFCARCGTRSTVASAGWKRVCPACGTEHFPRTDPVVIMRVEHGDRLLLGRSPRFPPGMWSCLAGFVEPGETVEAAVRRETLEEAGIEVGAVAYVASEPWPFPASLMIGMRARALTTEIQADPVELEDCRWFERAEIARMRAGDHPDGLRLPPSIAIAHHLLISDTIGNRDFVDQVVDARTCGTPGKGSLNPGA